MDSNKKRNEDSEDDEYLSDQSELSAKFEVLANSNDNETSSQGEFRTLFILKFKTFKVFIKFKAIYTQTQNTRAVFSKNFAVCL